MAWFEYKDQPQGYRKGVALRIRDLPKDVMDEFNKLMRPNENLTMVIVKEARKGQKVLLEGWSRVYGKDPINRHTVTYIRVDENPDWVCESDIGRGYKGKSE